MINFVSILSAIVDSLYKLLSIFASAKADKTKERINEATSVPNSTAVALERLRARQAARKNKPGSN
jgi:hypothetical protein